jgi:hypothetical protein
MRTRLALQEPAQRFDERVVAQNLDHERYLMTKWLRRTE